MSYIKIEKLDKESDIFLNTSDIRFFYEYNNHIFIKNQYHLLGLKKSSFKNDIISCLVKLNFIPIISKYMWVVNGGYDECLYNYPIYVNSDLIREICSLNERNIIHFEDKTELEIKETPSEFFFLLTEKINIDLIE